MRAIHLHGSASPPSRATSPTTRPAMGLRRRMLEGARARCACVPSAPDNFRRVERTACTSRARTGAAIPQRPRCAFTYPTTWERRLVHRVAESPASSSRTLLSRAPPARHPAAVPLRRRRRAPTPLDPARPPHRDARLGLRPLCFRFWGSCLRFVERGADMRRVLALLVVTAAAGCDSPQMSDCVRGWWTGTPQTCVVACMATPPPDACGSQDCQQIPVLGFDGDRYSTGTIAASASLHEF